MNTVQMRDRNGGVDFMARIPKFKLSDVIDGASDTVHPAFIVGGKEVDEIYVSKYLNSFHNRLPYSLPYQKAATSISYADAVRACALKGKWWHLMSNAEWAAIALWCKKNGTLPHGNTARGTYHADNNERGMTYDEYFTLTGSGPKTWAHDHTEDGIFDLCGNVWEWVSGLRIKDSVIQTIADNDVALNVDQSINSASWQDMIEPSSGKSIKFTRGDDIIGLTIGEAEGNPQMRLYALGALKKYEPFYGGMIKRVRMTIDQPRIQSEPSSETIMVDELKAWGETIKPIAQMAFSGFGEFKPGDHCRFCRGKAQCRARADVNTALEDFKDCLLPTAKNVEQAQQNAGANIPAMLTHDEIGELLVRGKDLVQWYKDLER